ncbi:MAG: hypothetical protein NTY77_04050 [Elusimicrobia bacterium]|nr:hypothetical protein [Elusimicrobiota bacterium]
MSHAEKSLLIFPVLAALAAAPLAAQDLPDLSAVQAQMSETFAAATAARPAPAAKPSRSAQLSCAAVVRDLDCLVEGEQRPIGVSKGPADDRFREFRTESSGKPVVMLLAPGANYDYDVHYDFDAKDYDAFVQGKVSSLKGTYVENIERLDPHSAPAVCTKPRQGSADYSIKGRLDLDSLALVVNSRSGERSPLLDVSKAGIVDERCGKTALAAADSLNYYVTPAHYWGEDILQLPKSAATGRVYVDGNLHLCQYDGDWSDSEDVPLHCSLRAEQ